MAKLILKGGIEQEVKLEATVWREAIDEGLTVPQLLNKKYGDDVDLEAGTPWEQLCVTSGLIRGDAEFGLRSPTLKDVMSGRAGMGAVTTADADPASRILYPAAILGLIESALRPDRTTDPNLFDTMIAVDTTISGPRAEQPVVTMSGPEQSRAKAIAQLAEPQVMLSITTADQTRAIPTLSIGLEVSDQALTATTLDFVSLVVGRQAEVERNLRVQEYLLGFLNGDSDYGQSALSQTTAQSLDATNDAAGEVTKKALVAWLFTNYYKRRISHIVTDLDGVMAIETALATTNTGNFPIPGMVPQFSVINRMFENLKIFVTDPSNTGAAWPANTLMGMDARSAIHRLRNASANYSAIEQFVLRRSKVLRFDFAEACLRLFDDAFDVLSLTVA